MINIKKMSCTGRRHSREKKQCEDYSFSCSIKGVSAVALADGAGSASRAAKGAMTAAKTAAVYLCENFERIYNSENVDKEKFFIIEAVKYEIQRLYSDEKYEDYNSTLVCVAVCDDRMLTVHLGDGTIAEIKNGETVFSVLSAPVNGLTGRQTYLTGMKNAYMYLKLYKRSCADVKALLLMTDGLDSDVFNINSARQRENIDTELIVNGDCDKYFRTIYSGDDDYSYAVVRM